MNETVAGPGGPFFMELWITPLGPAALHLAGFVVKTTQANPTVSPAFYQSSSNATGRIGEKVYAGDARGFLYSVWMSTGLVNWTAQLVRGVSSWTSAPIALPGRGLTPTTPPV